MNVTLWHDSSDLGDYKILEKFKKYNIPYKTKKPTDTVDQNSVNLYVIELDDVYNEQDLFTNMSERIKELLRKDVKLVFYYPSEGHKLENWFVKIYKDIEYHKLQKSKIFFVYGDYDFEKNYKKFINQHSLPSFITPIVIDYFLSEYYETSNFFNNSISEHKKYDYLFYNGKLRPHRLIAVAELKHRNVLNNGLVSLTDSTHTGRSYTVKQCINLLKEYKFYPNYLKEFVENWKPMILDMPGNVLNLKNQNNTLLKHYNSSYFSVVSETNVSYRFLTEKTYKPIANLHPFIMLAAPNVLELLRHKGFETFPELFDESYDKEQDPIKRILMVMDEIEKFCRLDDADKKHKINMVRHKLIYNKEHYLKLAKSSGQKEHIKILTQIEKTNEN